MDWTGGYTSDIEYTTAFFADQAPSHLNVVCALNGYEPPTLSNSFVYCELGCGRGLTANVLAAANPQATFYAADFKPSHIAEAACLAAKAELSNLTLLENSFEELACGQVAGLPQFDYISMHGVYSWVSPENRQHILNFIQRYLKPGGAVFVSYNAMPGWAAALPLQRLLVEFGAAFPDSSVKQLQGGAKLVERLIIGRAGYINDNPAIQPKLEGLKTSSPQYLAHEYMHRQWQPLYHADVARDLALVKMEFAGSATLPMAYSNLYLSATHKEAMDTFGSSMMRETLKDYVLNSVFRRDVFIRGLRKMSPARHAEVLSEIGVTLLVPRSRLNLELKTPIGTFNGMPKLYEAICDALAIRPHRLGELVLLPSLQGQGILNIMQAIVLLSSSGQVLAYLQSPGQVDVESAHMMNAALVAQMRYDDDHQVLCSPLAGNGIHTDLFERLVFSALLHTGHDVNLDDLTQETWIRMCAIGRHMTREGIALSSDKDNLAELRPIVEKILTDKVPLWRNLEML